MRAGSLSGTIVLDRFPEQVLVDRAEDFLGEFERSDFLAGQIQNIDVIASIFAFFLPSICPRKVFHVSHPRISRLITSSCPWRRAWKPSTG